MRRLLVGRAAKLEQLGLAAREGPAVGALEPGAENTLRDLSVRNDIIKTMHNAMSRDGGRFDVSALALHQDVPSEPIIGRLAIGRASCRARVCQYVSISVVAVSLEKKNQELETHDSVILRDQSI